MLKNLLNKFNLVIYVIKNSRKARIGLVISIIIFLSLVYIFFRFNPHNNKKSGNDLYEMGAVFDNNDSNFENSKEKNENDLESNNMIFVHIDGSVKNPGLYSLKYGSRLKDAIDISGGTTKTAYLKDVNFAIKLEDGEKIYIPNTEEKNTDALATSYGSNTSSQNSTKKININTANVEELKKLNGIGDSLANAILTYRKEKGKFKTIEQIKEVSGLGEAKFNKIKDSICI